MGKKVRVLFVDDEEIIVNAATGILENYNYNVIATTDSNEAFEYFSKDPDKFHIVVTDLNMPVLTGMELVKKIKKIRPHIPVIVCSGSVEDINPLRTEEMGINSFIAKPYRGKELASMIEDILKKK